jgi:hypothetical protein
MPAKAGEPNYAFVILALSAKNDNSIMLAHPINAEPETVTRGQVAA